jgi:hypothetical protein
MRDILGYACNRVDFRSIDGGGSIRGECWISSDLGIVMLDEVEKQGTMDLWRIVKVEERPPSSSVLALPEIFRS